MQIKLTHGTYENCHLLFGKYHNKRTAIQIQHNERPLMKATVNITEAILKHDEILVKNYEENEGLLQSLIDAEVIEDTGQFVATGYVIANVCKLLIDPDTYDKHEDARNS